MLTDNSINDLATLANEAVATVKALREQNQRLLKRCQEAESTAEVLKECDENHRGYLADYKRTVDEQRKSLEVALGAPSESYPARLRRVRDLRAGLMSALEPNVYTEQLSAVREAAGIAPGTASERWPGVIADMKEKAQRWYAAQVAPLDRDTIGRMVFSLEGPLDTAWDDVTEATREMYRRRGDAIVAHVRAHDAAADCTMADAVADIIGRMHEADGHNPSRASDGEILSRLRELVETEKRYHGLRSVNVPPVPALPTDAAPRVGDTVETNDRKFRGTIAYLTGGDTFHVGSWNGGAGGAASLKSCRITSRAEVSPTEPDAIGEWLTLCKNGAVTGIVQGDAPADVSCVRVLARCVTALVAEVRAMKKGGSKQ